MSICTTPVRRTLRTSAGALVVAAALVGCGSSTRPSSAATPTVGSASGATTTARATTAATTATASTPAPTAGSGLDPARSKAVELTVANIQHSGLGVDAACVAKLVAQLSDADVQAIVSAGPGATDVSMSPAGDALAGQLKDCFTTGTADPALVQKAVEVIMSSKSSTGIDRACLEKNLSLVDAARLGVIVNSAPGSVDPAKDPLLVGLVLDCIGDIVIGSDPTASG